MISSLNLLRLLVPRSGATPFGSIARTGFLQSTALPATLRCPQKFSSSAASVEEAVNAASSATPEVMYSGRTGRLQKFIDQQTSNGKTPLTMDMMLKAGHRSQYHYLGIQANDHIIDFFGDTIVGLVPGKGRGKGRFNWAEQKKLIDVGREKVDLIGPSKKNSSTSVRESAAPASTSRGRRGAPLTGSKFSRSW